MLTVILLISIYLVGFLYHFIITPRVIGESGITKSLALAIIWPIVDLLVIIYYTAENNRGALVSSPDRIEWFIIFKNDSNKSFTEPVIEDGEEYKYYIDHKDWDMVYIGDYEDAKMACTMFRSKNTNYRMTKLGVPTIV